MSDANQNEPRITTTEQPGSLRSRRGRAVQFGVVAVLTVAAAGCGTKADETSTSTTESAESTTTTAAGESTSTSATSSDAANSSSTTMADETTSSTAVSGSSAGSGTADMVKAGTSFLDSLSSEERAAVVFDFTDTAQRQRWSNLPQGLYDRAGLRWGDLDEDSQQAWLAVMQAVLSDEGYTQVMGEWGADDKLQGGDYGKDNYWVAFVGEPSNSDPWQFQFGGHHVTVNATIKGGDVSVTPSFIGVQPAMFDDNGKEIRPLGTIEDDAYSLVGSLDAAQKAKAVLGDTLIDLVVGPGQDGKTVENQGIVGSELTDAQKTTLLSLIGHYGNLVDEKDAAARMTQLEADLDSTYFAWYGSTDAANSNGIYFRVTGPHVVIEYSGQQMGGDPSDHIHGIYRDPTNDYGAAFGAGL